MLEEITSSRLGENTTDTPTAAALLCFFTR